MPKPDGERMVTISQTIRQLNSGISTMGTSNVKMQYTRGISQHGCTFILDKLNSLIGFSIMLQEDEARIRHEQAVDTEIGAD